MNKDLLLVVAHTLGSNGTNKWKEGWMFYKASIINGEILLPGMCLDEKSTREEADKFGLPLSTYLEKGIANNPELLRACRLARLGYIKKNLPFKKSVSSREIEEKNWNNFIIKVLSKKGDTINLEKFLRKGNVSNMEEV